MSSVTEMLETNLKSMMSNYYILFLESADLYSLYWGTAINTDVAALATGTTGATVSSHLTKDEFILGLTLTEQLKNMFGNAAVTTGDYLQSTHLIVNGTASISVVVSNGVESMGDRLLALSHSCLNLYRSAKFNLDLYFDNEVGDCVAVMDPQRIMFGSNVTVSDLSTAVTLLQKFVAFMENSAVATNDYASTLSKWALY